MGRDKRNEKKTDHFTKMIRNNMETPAWRALSPVAQALYPWLKFEWHGANSNNNGKISLSVRQAAKCIGVNHKTAAKAFHDLQAKGFIVVKQAAVLGVDGEAKSPCFEITELPLPGSDLPTGRKLFRDWKDGEDFPIQKAATHNPTGENGKSCPRKGNGTVVKFGTK